MAKSSEDLYLALDDGEALPCPFGGRGELILPLVASPPNVLVVAHTDLRSVGVPKCTPAITGITGCWIVIRLLGAMAR